jgi:hypothetical protein
LTSGPILAIFAILPIFAIWADRAECSCCGFLAGAIFGWQNGIGFSLLCGDGLVSLAQTLSRGSLRVAFSGDGGLLREYGGIL